MVGLGGYEFEDDPDWPGARDVLLAAAETGIDWVDTAETYFDGGSDRTIGAGLRDTGVSMRISSKVGPARGGTGFRPEQVRRACEASLERLRGCPLHPYLLHRAGQH